MSHHHTAMLTDLREKGRRLTPQREIVGTEIRAIATPFTFRRDYSIKHTRAQPR